MSASSVFVSTVGAFCSECYVNFIIFSSCTLLSITANRFLKPKVLGYFSFCNISGSLLLSDGHRQTFALNIFLLCVISAPRSIGLVTERSFQCFAHAQATKWLGYLKTKTRPSLTNQHMLHQDFLVIIGDHSGPLCRAFTVNLSNMHCHLSLAWKQLVWSLQW